MKCQLASHWLMPTIFRARGEREREKKKERKTIPEMFRETHLATLTAKCFQTRNVNFHLGSLNVCGALWSQGGELSVYAFRMRRKAELLYATGWPILKNSLQWKIVVLARFCTNSTKLWHSLSLGNAPLPQLAFLWEKRPEFSLTSPLPPTHPKKNLF